MVDRKISDFPLATTLDDADILDLIHGGVNQKITWANAKATVFTALFTNASDFQIDADATSAGDRSVTFKLTASTFVRLLWNSASSIFQLVNQTGTLQKLAIANGTGSTHAITKSQLDAAVTALSAAQVFTEIFESTLQTISPAGSLSIAHGLSDAPKRVDCFLVCQTAEYDYTVGQTIIAPNFAYFITASGTAYGQGQSIILDSTNIIIRYAAGGGGTTVYSGVHATTGVPVNFVDANWKLKVVAYL